MDREKILLIHRISGGKEYYIIPGGGRENESPEEAAIREILEETSLSIFIDEKLWEYTDDFDGRLNHIFLATKFSGKLQLSGGEAERNSQENQFILEWHHVQDLSCLNFFPVEIKNRILKKFGNPV
jgi:8-oxo-dGTP pyrophosphatase MutT (NUDIX family)